MIVTNVTRTAVLSNRCRFANSFWKRLVGLLDHKAMAEGEGLLLDHCQGIHTFGMRFPIDVLYLDKDFHVLQTVTNLRPFRASLLRTTAFVLELPAGTIHRTRTVVGDEIHIRITNVMPLHKQHD